jgi:hypothetical protein
MPNLNFKIIQAEAPTHTVAPLLSFQLVVENKPPTERIHTVLLQCQIQIESVKRQYNDREREKLVDLFGEPSRWGQTLRKKLWTHASVSIPAFEERTTIDINVPCSYDLNVVGTKYFYSLEEGNIPLLFLFSGTVFYEDEDGRLQVTQIPWNNESAFQLPVSLWKQMIENHYPNSAFVYLERDAFERLYQYKRQHGLPTWEKAIERLLPNAADERLIVNGEQ